MNKKYDSNINTNHFLRMGSYDISVIAMTMEELSQNLCDGKSFCLMGREYRDYQEARGRKKGRYDCRQQESEEEMKHLQL